MKQTDSINRNQHETDNSINRNKHETDSFN